MIDHFTDRARRTMQLANQEAQRFNHEAIAPEHILLGLIKEGGGVAGSVLANLDCNLSKVRQQVEKLIEPRQEMVTMGKLPQTARAKKVVQYAVEEARDLDHRYVGTEHLLLGLLRLNDGIVPVVFSILGLKTEDVRQGVHDLLGTGPTKDRSVNPLPSRALLAFKRHHKEWNLIQGCLQLHLNVGMFVPKLLDEGEDPIEGAAQTLLTLMALIEEVGVSWEDVLATVEQTVTNLEKE